MSALVLSPGKSAETDRSPVTGPTILLSAGLGRHMVLYSQGAGRHRPPSPQGLAQVTICHK